MRNPRQRHSGRVAMRRIGLALAVLCWVGGLTTTNAQTKPAIPTTATMGRDVRLPAADVIQGHISQLEQMTGLDQTVRAKAIEAYKQALLQLVVSKNWQDKIAVFETAVKEAPIRLAEAKRQLELLSSQATSAPSRAASVELEPLLASAKAELAAVEKELANVKAEPNRRADRRAAIPRLIPAIRQRLEELDQKPSSPTPAQLPELVESDRVLRQIQTETLRLEIEAYQKELASYDAERDLLAARLELAVRRKAVREKQVSDLQESFDKSRRAEAEQAVREAQEATERTARIHPSLRELAEENAAMAKQRTGPDGLAARISSTNQVLDETIAALTRLQDKYKTLKEKEKVIGETATFGVLLRKQRADLPDVRQYGQKAKSWQSEISEIQLRLIELQERQTAQADIDGQVKKIVARLEPSVSGPQRDRIAALARELLVETQKNLSELINDYNVYFGNLVDLDVQARMLVNKTSEVASYIDERVLWIRSAELLGWRDVSYAAKPVGWLLGPETWGSVGKALFTDARKNPLGSGAVVLLFSGLLIFRRSLTRRSTAKGRAAGRWAADNIGPTIWALAATSLRVLTLPAIVWFIAWRLSSSAETFAAAKSVASGLQAVAAVLIAFGTLIEIYRPKGLAEIHFQWSVPSALRLRKSLRALIIVVAPVGFVIASLESYGDEVWKNSLGRLALMVGLVTMAVFAHRLLRPSGPLQELRRKKSPTGRLYRFRYLWHMLAVSIPILLILLAALGFYFTALHLVDRMAVTLWLVLAVVVAQATALRWFSLFSRKLATNRPLPELETAESDDGSRIQTATDTTEQLVVAHTQTRHLLRYVAIAALIVGTWHIWSSSLPALGALRRVQLWTRTVKTTAPVAIPGVGPSEQTVESVVSVTLADAGLAVLIVVLMVVTVRNVPGMLDVVVLQRTGMDAGARYASKAILSYVIAVTGTVVAFAMIGVGWSSVQWMLAAMTVGLGFGLQEIFANFVSGLIILFERPIRIGDTVTVSDTTGTVTRIRIRATTITDWDRKELVVPNKEFVTGRLVNWSLSDKVLRVILRVGIAYGSDTELAEKVLYEKASEHPLVQADPEPVVVFSAFGDNSLNFELRVYISGIGHYLKVWHDLNMSIDKAFRENGITIAFPQRDMHLNTTNPLDIRILPTGEVCKSHKSPGGNAALES